MANMLDCREVVARLGPFLDAELPSQDARLIEAHVEECPGCRGELQALQALSASLEAVVAPPVPVGISDEIMRRVRGQQRELHGNWGIFEFWKPWPVAMRLSAAGVTAAACVIGLMLASAISEQPSQTRSEMAWVELASGSGIVSAYLDTAR
jgi:anti-sigma factor RsiW